MRTRNGKQGREKPDLTAEEAHEIIDHLNEALEPVGPEAGHAIPRTDTKPDTEAKDEE